MSKMKESDQNPVSSFYISWVSASGVFGIFPDLNLEIGKAGKMYRIPMLVAMYCMILIVPIVSVGNKERYDVLNGNRDKYWLCMKAITVLSGVAMVCFGIVYFLDPPNTQNDVPTLGECALPFAILSAALYGLFMFALIRYKNEFIYDEKMELKAGEYKKVFVPTVNSGYVTLIKYCNRLIRASVFPPNYTGRATLYLKTNKSNLERISHGYDSTVVGYELHDPYKYPTGKRIMKCFGMIMFLCAPPTLLFGRELNIDPALFILFVVCGGSAFITTFESKLHAMIGWPLFFLSLLAIVHGVCGVA